MTKFNIPISVSQYNKEWNLKIIIFDNDLMWFYYFCVISQIDYNIAVLFKLMRSSHATKTVAKINTMHD